MSARTVELAAGSLPVGVSLLELGEHRLKDLEGPQRLLQVCHPDLDAKFPPLRSLELVRHNLPVQTSSFVGRQTELGEVAKALDTARLVSVLGPGGTGKTRLAYQAAAEAVETFPGGIWVAELASAGVGDSVSSVLLRGLSLREEPDRDPADTAVEYLRDRQALVILDNCEHVVEQAAHLAQTLLSSCPGVRVLATSREALRVAGEVCYPLGGLSLPSGWSSEHLQELAATDAVRLFVARAAAVRPGFGLNAANAEDVAAICVRLDCLPLAIELAASRIRALSPGQLNLRLANTLDVLSKGSRGASSRQATLRGAIEWSHELLEEAERVLFRRLAVFVGGWRLEAAEQVCAGQGLAADAVLDTLHGLVDKSLVAVGEDDDGEVRYRLLETISAYAAERLADAGETDLLADQHATWCLALAEQASHCQVGSDEEAVCFDRLEADHRNLLAGLANLGCRADLAQLELADWLHPFWLVRGHWRVGRAQLEAAQRAGSEPSLARHRVLGALGAVVRALGDYPEARARFEEACAIAADLGDRTGQRRWLAGLGNVAFELGDYPQAQAYFEEALALARDLGDRTGEGDSLGKLGSVAASRGDYPLARARLEEGVAIARDLGDRGSEGLWLGNLGLVAYSQGRLPAGPRPLRSSPHHRPRCR